MNVQDMDEDMNVHDMDEDMNVDDVDEDLCVLDILPEHVDIRTEDASHPG